MRKSWIYYSVWDDFKLMDQPALRGVGTGRLLVDRANPWFSIAEVVGGPRIARAVVSTVDVLPGCLFFG